MRIVFFGTPDFAVASLEALIQANFDVVAVVERAGCEDGKRLRADGGVPKIVEADGQVARRVLEAAAEKRKKR